MGSAGSFVVARNPEEDSKRPRLARSQFVFTEVRGRPAIFWQTQRTARRSNPGGRVPRGRATTGTITILVDTRERYPFRFVSRRDVTTERAGLPAGDYGVRVGDRIVAVVERKTLENLATGLSDGSLAFQMQRLAEEPAAAVVVEGRYPAILDLPHAPASFLADVLARLQVRYRRAGGVRGLAEIRGAMDLQVSRGST